MTEARIPVRWISRDIALPARAVVAVGATAKALGQRLSQLADEALAELTAVAGEDVIVVIGESSALPWVDGVTYAGRDEAAPELLLPTALRPTVPVPVLAAAVRKLARNAVPILVLPEPERLIPCGTARAIDRERLMNWLEAE